MNIPITSKENELVIKNFPTKIQSRTASLVNFTIYKGINTNLSQTLPQN